MSRSVVAKLFYGSLIAIVGAVILIIIAGALALSSSSLRMDGPDVVGIGSAFGWTMLALAVLAGFVIVVASIAQFVAWIGALIESTALESKTWFVVLLVIGLMGFGTIVVLVYLLAEPGPGRADVQSGSAPAAIVDAG